MSPVEMYFDSEEKQIHLKAELADLLGLVPAGCD